MTTSLTIVILSILFLAIAIALGFFIRNLNQKAGLT